MRAAALVFGSEHMDIIKGIKLSRKDDTEKLYLYGNSMERMLSLRVDINNPPLILRQLKEKDPNLYYLSRLSFAVSTNGTFLASREAGDGEKSLLFIDTIDDKCEQRNSGEYSLPLHHEEWLEHGFAATKYGPSQFGLVLCAPRDTCVIRSTSGHLIKVQLDDNGEFFRIPCDVRDRALMDGRL